MKVLLCAVLLSLTACTTVWDRPGLTDAEWNQDTYACELASRGLAQPAMVYAPPTMGTGAGLVNTGDRLAAVGMQKRMFDRCMVSKGYEKVR